MIYATNAGARRAVVQSASPIQVARTQAAASGKRRLVAVGRLLTVVRRGHLRHPICRKEALSERAHIKYKQTISTIT